ncbi:hypothetical protein [Epilithonimonas xixisoli]|uniref:Uncharacterized protein n=1 Tax=Epilithonimonas xixisoli TaxID=1476462 RepID=A0A4R8I548_9FLAO|nr:hypothetical protein [Epilithonimonas xixisoli]TDX84017.1 hypothetical protein B0I22_1607 [Epilithonimonas xixisoli]
MQFSLRFLFLFLFAIVKSQNIDSLANVPSELKETEIRIYKDRGITNSGFVFRIYKEDKTWKANLTQWFLPKEISRDEVEWIKPEITILKSEKSLEEVFVNVEARNIKFLPKEETFKYKKSNKKVEYDEDEKAFLMTTLLMTVVDGTGYSVKYQSGKQQNEFSYNNPESYLKEYPNIDELNDFVDILKYIRKEFNIEF